VGASFAFTIFPFWPEQLYLFRFPPSDSHPGATMPAGRMSHDTGGRRHTVVTNASTKISSGLLIADHWPLSVSNAIEICFHLNQVCLAGIDSLTRYPRRCLSKQLSLAVRAIAWRVGIMLLRASNGARCRSALFTAASEKKIAQPKQRPQSKTAQESSF